MLRTIIVIAALATVPLATVAEAQGRARNRNDAARAQGIPPGQMPPDDLCRVWYSGRPPGQQPAPMRCDRAEAIASRDRNARVIYGADAYNRSGWYGDDRNGRYGRNSDDDRGVYRVPGRNRAPNGGYYPNGSSYRYSDTAFQNGYRDGRQQGLEDGRDRDRFDATRHGRYRSADRGYLDSYGNKNAYKDIYRDGFRAGYEAGYREGDYRRR